MRDSIKILLFMINNKEIINQNQSNRPNKIGDSRKWKEIRKYGLKDNRRNKKMKLYDYIIRMLYLTEKEILTGLLII